MFQVHSSITRPASMFLNLRHLTYEIIIFTKVANRHSGILQLAQYLSFVPQLETLELHASGLLFLFVFLSFFLCRRTVASCLLFSHAWMDLNKSRQLFGYIYIYIAKNTDRVPVV